MYGTRNALLSLLQTKLMHLDVPRDSLRLTGPLGDRWYIRTVMKNGSQTGWNQQDIAWH